MRGVRGVEVVDDRVDHDCLLGDGEGAVCGDCYPVVWNVLVAGVCGVGVIGGNTSLECERFAGNKDNV